MMLYRTSITEVEICDDTHQLAAKVIAFDEGAGTVEVHGCHNATSWAQLSAAILQALKSMEFEGDEK